MTSFRGDQGPTQPKQVLIDEMTQRRIISIINGHETQKEVEHGFYILTFEETSSSIKYNFDKTEDISDSKLNPNQVLMHFSIDEMGTNKIVAEEENVHFYGIKTPEQQTATDKFIKHLANWCNDNKPHLLDVKISQEDGEEKLITKPETTIRSYLER